MRHEEAEQEATWRNAHDERRNRLEFYAFDASAGLADDAWEVTMRLRREPAPAAPAVEAPREAGAPPPDPWEEAPQAPAAREYEYDPRDGEPSDAPRARADRWEENYGWEEGAAEPWDESEADRWEWADRFLDEAPAAEPARSRRRDPGPSRRQTPRRESEETGPRRGRRRGAGHDDETDVALRPHRGALERLTRLVGATVIFVALVWVGTASALAVMIGDTSITAAALFVGALLVGTMGVGLGVIIRRA